MPDICKDMVGNRPRRSPCFLLAGERWLNAPFGFPILFGHFSKCICYFVSIAEKVSNTLWAFPKGRQYPFSTAQMVSKSIQTHFAMCFNINLDIPLDSTQRCMFLYIKIKNQRCELKNHQRFFSSYDLYNHTAYSQLKLVRQTL